METGMLTDEKEAAALIMEGRVFCNGKKVDKPGEMVDSVSGIKVEEGRRYVSRGGNKLEGAFSDFGLDAERKKAADIGSSTGGFTDYLLQNGADKVTAIDVGRGILAWKLVKDSRVTVLEKTNMRYIDPSVMEYSADMVTVDLSFISIRKVFRKIMDISAENAEILLLVKPQFELDRKFVRHKGVVKEKEYHIAAMKDMMDFVKEFKVSIEGISFSKIKGASGNIEFWIYLRKIANSGKSLINYDKIIQDTVNSAHLFFKKEKSDL